MGEEFQPGTEAYRNVKNQINKEGWQRADEGDGEGAVFIGTKAEAEAARARLESKEATFADLRSYIAANSVVVAGPEETREALRLNSPDNLAKKFEEYPAGIFIWNRGTDSKDDYTIIFKSKDGSLKQCTIDMKRISDMGDPEASQAATGKVSDHPGDIIQRSLEGLGFNSHIPSSNFGGCYDLVLQQRVKKSKVEKSAQGFEF